MAAATKLSAAERERKSIRGDAIMASTGKCKFCGGVVRSDERKCPQCGAENENFVADTSRSVFLPKTIPELQEYCAERGMPLLRMRFFIGEDFREPRAFGIYQDGEDFVVYKNKSDGSRAIRYRGPDEAYAVNELFQKLLEECHNRGIYPDGKPDSRSGASLGKRKSQNGKSWLAIILAFLLGLGLTFAFSDHHRKGYYQVNEKVYYHIGSDWYGYNGSDWYETNEPHLIDYDADYLSDSFSSGWGVSNFSNSSAYQDYQDRHSSSSSDYDSWDSSDTDWDSDW